MSPPCCPVYPGIRRTVLCILVLTALCSCLHQYHFVNETKTWNEAQMYCRKTYSDLATIDDMGDMEELILAAGSDYEGEVWIGLYDNSVDWEWSLGDLSLYGSNEWNFKKWNKSQPSSMRTQARLCVAFQQGFWFDYFCNKPLTFVCYNNTKTVDSPTSIEKYFFINKEKAWYDAQTYCRQNYTDLVSVRNETENMVIQQVLPPYQMASIGLYRFTWVWWSDSSSSSFKNWADGHPLANTGDCAASVINATYLGKWVENQCDTKLNFICHNNKKQVFIVKLRVVKSTVNLKNPDVLEAILKLMEDKMNNAGYTRDFTISWKITSDKNVFHKEVKTGV